MLPSSFARLFLRIVVVPRGRDAVSCERKARSRSPSSLRPTSDSGSPRETRSPPPPRLSSPSPSPASPSPARLHRSRRTHHPSSWSSRTPSLASRAVRSTLGVTNGNVPENVTVGDRARACALARCARLDIGVRTRQTTTNVCARDAIACAVARIRSVPSDAKGRVGVGVKGFAATLTRTRARSRARRGATRGMRRRLG